VTNTTKSGIGFLEQFEPDIFWEKHGRKVVSIIVAVLALGVAAFLWQKRAAQEEENAAARLAEARDAVSLQRIIQDYQGKNVAAAAMIRLGDIYFRDGKYSEAVAVYQKFLTEYPRHPFVQSARLGLAAVQEAQGDLQAAKEQYLQLASSDPTGYVSLAARMGAARCAEAVGQTKEARKMYEELLPAAQGSPWQSDVFVRWTVLSREQQRETLSPTQQELNLPLNPTGAPAPVMGRQP
jgi:tetratricopeptide (TPR) repeat protein